MKKQVILISVFMALSIRMYPQCADSGNIYTFTYDGKTYEIVKELKSWTDAATCAVERGGSLAEINSLSEQDAMFDAIINGAMISTTYTSIPNGGGIAYVWIGATDQTTEDIWLWDGNNDNTGLHFWTGQGSNGSGNGMPVNEQYNNWGGTSNGTPSEPDNYNSNQDHGAIGLAGWPSGTTILGSPGEWNDIIGSSLLYFIIEKGNPSGSNHRIFNPDKKIKICPNVTTGIFFIESELNYNSVEIFNLSGNRLMKLDKCSRVNLAGFGKNLYFVRITGDSFTWTGEVIVK
jgi:hypothetical protein